MDNRQWLLTLISDSQLSLLKSNKISLREILINPEVGLIWRLSHNNLTKKIESELICSDQLREDELPAEDAFLDYADDNYLPVIEDSVLESSMLERRDIIDVAFISSKQHKREIECSALSEILKAFQQVVYTLSLNVDRVRNRFSQEIRDRCTVVVAGTFASSFGVRLKSSELSDVFGNTDLSESLKELTELFDSKNDENKLRIILKQHSVATLLSYRQLMKVFNQSEIEFNIKIASPNYYFYHTEFSNDDIKRNLALLSGELNDLVFTEKILGNMVGINTDKKTFVFKSVDDENIIGKLSDSFIGFTFTIPKFVEATMEKRISFKEFTGEEKKSYILLSIDDHILEKDENAKNI